MTRPLRIEFDGALYHVTSRGDRKEAIYDDTRDREQFLQILGDVIDNYNWICPAYCLMGNHYHLLIETPDANLSKGMRQLNGVYTQASNRRHGRVGHLFQGRYKAILVDRDAYFLELSRYVVLNPVRAGLVKLPVDWRWSSYRATLDTSITPAWLYTDSLLRRFGRARPEAIRRYARFVAEGVGGESIWRELNRQIYLGDDDFVGTMQGSDAATLVVTGVPKVQKCHPPPSIEQLASGFTGRDQGILAAYSTGAYSYHQIAQYFGLHYTTVGRIVRKARNRR
ncbi:MAG TPA: transposase [Halieaceae bacterium]|nr:transposase [Halieaceae bacterium]